MPEIVVIGGGFAGIATAYRLARRGATDVLVLERDPAPGQRASGRNAGMIRTLVPDPAVQALALSSAAFLGAPPGDLAGDPVFRRTGSVVLATGADADRLRAAAARSRAADRGVAEAAGPAGGAEDWVPPEPGLVSFATGDDGVADVHALLSAYLRAARARGVRLRTGAEVTEVLVEAGRAVGVRTRDGAIRAPVVVNAAGAWAGGLGRAGAGAALGLVSRRRHLYTTAPVPGLRADAPFVWHDSAGYYFRPESGGLLLSGCDESPHPPGEPAVDPIEEERLAEKLVRRAPALADLTVANRWACLRTFAPDRRFVVGWDPVLPGLFWVAALGGHGVTVSAAVGDLAAEKILAGPGREEDDPFSPSAARIRTA